MIFPLENNSTVKSTILNFISARRIPHAIMIEGDNFDENLALADFIAKAAVCADSEPPCDKCLNCHQADVKTHPDIAYIRTEDGKKNLSVGQVRQIRADAFVKPHSANRRVFIIEQAQRLNEQAQNALLKVLEEPPQNVVFILVTPSKTALLDTIISRCVVLSLYSDEQQDSDYTDMADRFLDIMFSGSDYEMLKLLTPLEKNRISAQTFFETLSIRCAKRIKNGNGNARVLNSVFDDIKYYLDLLETNINMPLLFSTVVIRTKSYVNK